MDLLKKSIDELKKLQFKNGGILATPKNGAYPYVYVRDSVIITRAFNSVGLWKNSERFYYFMNKFSNLENYKEVFHRYNLTGEPCVTREKENDNGGLLIYGIYDTYLHSKREKFLEDMWLIVKQTSEIIISNIKEGLVKTEKSIHEFEDLEKGYDIWVNSACCRGLKDASEIARILGHEAENKRYNEKYKLILREIKKRLFNRKKGIFIKNIKFPDAPDMSQLAPFYFEIINSKVILKRTLNFLRKHLWEENLGGFRRFRKFEICDDWHWYSGGSGSWIWLTLWVARFYKDLGNKREYKKCLNWVNKLASYSKGLLPEHIAFKEEYDAWKKHEIEFNSRIINEAKKVEKSFKEINKKKVVYWANPLGWSHAEYILLRKK